MAPSAAIISVGNELLSGKTINTNAAFISLRLGEIGISVVAVYCVGDNSADIERIIHEACQIAPIVVCTGGLGPTRDDITKRAAAKVFGREIRIDHDQLRIVKEKFRAAGYAHMPENNVSQAELPAGAFVFPNPVGTAPGLLIVEGQAHMFMLPGVPEEMMRMMTGSVIPNIQRNFGSDKFVVCRTIRTAGIGESALAEMLEPIVSALPHIDGNPVDPEVAFLPDPFSVDIRLTAKGADETSLREKIAWIEREIVSIAGEYIFGFDDDTLASVVGALLRRRNLTIAAAESCTGGLLCDRITAVPGSSDYFLCGIVTYSNESKIRHLGVEPEIIRTKGAVSEETAREMAEGVKHVCGTDIGISTTGIAGPSGGTPEKPVGLMYAALSDRAGTIIKKFQFRGERIIIKKRASQAALHLLWKRLNDTNVYSD